MSVGRRGSHRGVRAFARLGEAMLLHALVWVGLRAVSWARLIASLARFSSISHSTASPVSEITWAAGAVGRRVRATCLNEALVAYTMLRRHGHEPLLRIGVRHGDRDRAALEAHAWVECDGAVVVGTRSEIGDYAVLA